MKTIPFYKKKKWYVLLAILLGAGGLYAYFSQEAPATYETITAERGELIQEVSVTGRVKAVESADLAFETSGRVAESTARCQIVTLKLGLWGVLPCSKLVRCVPVKAPRLC